MQYVRDPEKNRRQQGEFHGRKDRRDHINRKHLAARQVLHYGMGYQRIQVIGKVQQYQKQQTDDDNNSHQPIAQLDQMRQEWQFLF